MASASDISAVRLNVNEPTEDVFTDIFIGAYVDAEGVAGASATIWRQKAAKYADLVSTTQGGTQHAFSDLHKSALKMAEAFGGIVTEEVEADVSSGPRIKSIVRE